MVRFTLLLAISGVTIAKLTGFLSQKRDSIPLLRGPTLSLADTCTSTCDEIYCMDDTGECCGVGDGSYCPAGNYCIGSGCCKIGKLCDPDAEVEGCSSGYEECGDKFCMPEGAVCCSDGSHCDNGEICGVNGCISGKPDSVFSTKYGSVPTPTSIGNDDPYTTSINVVDETEPADPAATDDYQPDAGAQTTVYITADSSDDNSPDPQSTSISYTGGTSAGSLITPKIFGTILAIMVIL